MSSTPQKKLLKTKSDFKTSVGSFQIESKCLQHLKKSSLQQNPTSKHPLDHFRSSPNVFNTSKKAPNNKIRLQNIRWIISDRVQMSSTPQKKLLTTKSDFKTSVGSFQIESKCLQHLKKKLLKTKSDFKTSVGSFQIESKCLQHLKKSS